jgi:hypothetical protein
MRKKGLKKGKRPVIKDVSRSSLTEALEEKIEKRQN